MARPLHSGSGGRRRDAGRGALVCSVALGLAGCVIPIGPEFERETNLSPYYVSADPPINSVISRSADNRLPKISVTIGDPNLGDRLFVRWIFDYPIRDKHSRMFPAELGPSENGKPERTPLEFRPDCQLHNVSSEVNPHRLMVAVSDRPYLEPEENGVGDFVYTTIRSGANLWLASWTVDMGCPP